MTGAFLRETEDATATASCADIRWTVAELVAHLGAVHRWAAANSREAKRHPRTNVPNLDVALAEWYSTSRDVLLDTFEKLDPEAIAYTLSKNDRTVSFWYRRQLFETLVHLWDLRSASDPAAPPPAEVDAATHADGVSELFDVFLPRTAAPAPLGGGLELVATDTGDRWSFGNDWQRDGVPRAHGERLGAGGGAAALGVESRASARRRAARGRPRGHRAVRALASHSVVRATSSVATEVRSARTGPGTS